MNSISISTVDRTKETNLNKKKVTRQEKKANKIRMVDYYLLSLFDNKNALMSNKKMFEMCDSSRTVIFTIHAYCYLDVQCNIIRFGH